MGKRKPTLPVREPDSINVSAPKKQRSKGLQLEEMQSDLRQKYLNEIDAIQRSTATVTARIEKLKQYLDSFLELIDGLKLDDPQAASTNKKDMATETSCPICFEEMVSPKSILCCSNGHAICSDCEKQVKECPVCRESFDQEGRPQRNKFAERLIAAYYSESKE